MMMESHDCMRVLSDVEEFIGHVDATQCIHPLHIVATVQFLEAAA